MGIVWGHLDSSLSMTVLPSEARPVAKVVERAGRNDFGIRAERARFQWEQLHVNLYNHVERAGQLHWMALAAPELPEHLATLRPCVTNCTFLVFANVRRTAP